VATEPSPGGKPLTVERDFRRIVDPLAHLVWIARPDGSIDYYNQSCFDYTGLTFDELQGWGWQRVVHPDDVELKLRRWTEAVSSAIPFEIEYRLRQADGTYRWHLARALPIRDEAGQVDMMFGTSTDIEDQKQTQAALRESQETLEQRVTERTRELSRANVSLKEEIADRRRIEEEIGLLNSIIQEITSAEDLTASLNVVLRRVCEKTGWACGQAWIPSADGSRLDCASWFCPDEALDSFRMVSRNTTFLPGVGLPGRVWSSNLPAWVRDVTEDTNFPRAQAAREVGLKAALCIPIAASGRVVALIEFFLREPRDEDERLVKVIETVAAQLDLVLERKRAEEERAEKEAALRISYERIQDLAGRLIAAQEAERARIARDLHDDINQQIAGLSIALSSLKRRAGEHHESGLEPVVAALQQRATTLADNVRHLSHQLHPGVLQHVGLVAALSSHCSEIGRQHEIEIAFTPGENLSAVPAETALCLFRATQEALRNVIRHAGARRAQVAINREGDQAVLSIADDGHGFDSARMQGAAGGLGLRSIEERARLLHGTVRIDSGPGGTTVRVTAPL
jgi:PAS domain S-box-containing protein